MKKLILILASAIVMMPLLSCAANLTFNWSTYSDPQATSLAIYQTFEGEEILKLPNIPVGDTSASFADELVGDCNTYYIRALTTDTVRSVASETAAWCADGVIPAETTIPGSVGGFTITINVEPN